MREQNYFSEIKEQQDAHFDTKNQPRLAKFENQATLHVMVKFGKDVLIRCQQFKDELLASCLTFLLTLPVTAVESDFAAFVSSIELALSLGLGYVLSFK